MGKAGEKSWDICTCRKLREWVTFAAESNVCFPQILVVECLLLNWIAVQVIPLPSIMANSAALIRTRSTIRAWTRIATGVLGPKRHPKSAANLSTQLLAAKLALQCVTTTCNQSGLTTTSLSEVSDWTQFGKNGPTTKPSVVQVFDSLFRILFAMKLDIDIADQMIAQVVTNIHLLNFTWKRFCTFFSVFDNKSPTWSYHIYPRPPQSSPRRIHHSVVAVNNLSSDFEIKNIECEHIQPPSPSLVPWPGEIHPQSWPSFPDWCRDFESKSFEKRWVCYES